MGIDLEGIVIIVGNYGSGKTEVAVNLAVSRKNDGLQVRIADLDLVNPYFRTREARERLTRIGIEVVLPPAKYLNADLPILSREVAGMIRRPCPLTLIDAGGDDVGATVLSSLADSFRGRSVKMIQVVNPFRPFTDSVAGCLRIREEIEAASRLRVTGIAGNANLIDETTAEDILEGYHFASRLAEESGLPLQFITVPAGLMPQIDMTRLTCPVLAIRRQMVPPWKKATVLEPPQEETAAAEAGRSKTR